METHTSQLVPQICTDMDTCEESQDPKSCSLPQITQSSEPTTCFQRLASKKSLPGTVYTGNRLPMLHPGKCYFLWTDHPSGRACIRPRPGTLRMAPAKPDRSHQPRITYQNGR